MKKTALCILLVLLAAVLLFYPSFAAEGALNGLKMCGNILVPSLFPYMVLSAWAVGKNLLGGVGRILEKPLGFLFNMPSAAISPILIGWVCGYPAGIRAAASEYEYGRLSKRQTERLMTFCACISPQFAIGVLGVSVFGSSYAGVCIYLGALLSCVAVGIAGGIIGRFSEKDKKRERGSSTQLGFTEAVADASEGMLKICSLTVFFAAMIGIAEGSGLLKQLSFWLSAKTPGLGDGFWKATLKGVIELTSGALEVSAVRGGFLICAVGAGFGGVCVICQCVALARVNKEKLRILPMVASRIVHGALTAVIASILISFDKSSATVFSVGVSGGALKIGVDNIPAAVVMLMTAVTVMLKGAGGMDTWIRKDKRGD